MQQGGEHVSNKSRADYFKERRILLTPLHRGRKRLKLCIKRVKLFLYEQKSIQKVRKNQNEKERKSKKEWLYEKIDEEISK